MTCGCALQAKSCVFESIPGLWQERETQSGEGEIRTPEPLAWLPVFKTDSDSPYEQVPQGDTEINPTVLQGCLQESPEIDPDLQRVASAWPALPEHIRRAILALVATADKRSD